MRGWQRDGGVQLDGSVSVDGGEQLIASSVEQGAARAHRALDQGTVRHGQQRPDTNEGSVEAHAQALGQRDAHSESGERPRSDADTQAIQARFGPARVGERALDQRQQELRVGIGLFVLEAAHHEPILEQGDRAASGRSLEAKSTHDARV